MSDTEDLDLQMSGVFVRDTDLAVVLAMAQEDIDKNIDGTFIYYTYDGQWCVCETKKAIVSAGYPPSDDLDVALLSADGMAMRLSLEGGGSHAIDESDDGPGDLVVMREIKLVDNTQFAVGMARLAYRKQAGATGWERIDKTCFVPRAERTSAVGFYSVDGFSASDVYAVGYKGEIWKFDGSAWTMRTSPTNVVLTKVVCDRANEQVVIVGLAGTILTGRGDTWNELEQTETRADFWGATAFAGSVYVANDEGVFRLRGGELEKVRIADSRITTSYLSSGGGEMWSVGNKDIFKTVDGEKWVRVENP